MADTATCLLCMPLVILRGIIHLAWRSIGRYDVRLH
jgi:hypothetical protein